MRRLLKAMNTDLFAFVHSGVGCAGGIHAPLYRPCNKTGNLSCVFESDITAVRVSVVL